MRDSGTHPAESLRPCSGYPVAEGMLETRPPALIMWGPEVSAQWGTDRQFGGLHGT